MFTRRRPQAKRASYSSASNPVSPIQPSFNFQLSSAPIDPVPPPPTSSSIPRIKTNYGVPAETDIPTNLQLLPPIPRVASRQGSIRSVEETDDDDKINGTRRYWEGDEVSVISKSSAPNTRLSSEHAREPVRDLSRPVTPSQQKDGHDRPSTSAGDSSTSVTPEMTSSLFPARRASPVSARASTDALSDVMDRSFIDSRDRPYQARNQLPFLMQTNHSSPNLTHSVSPAYVARQPIPSYSSGRNWFSPTSSMQNLSLRSTNASGSSTARPSTQASSSYTGPASSSVTTVGTPYLSTADSFPPPQPVRIRPKTPGAVATVAGHPVPTHHTSGTQAPRKPAEPKKKGLLRNPLALLQRRRSNQDPELVVEERAARQAQAQALARQRDLVTSGINKPPPDFDPRIKGKLVHDFSAPREKRNTFHEMNPTSTLGGIQNPNSFSSPTPSAYPPRNASLVNNESASRIEGQQKKNVHTPVFVEHLNEHPEASYRISSIHAENLENKDFLQRASKQSSVTTSSQESAILPPFARRSQMIDANQAAFYQDDDSKNSSHPSSENARDSTMGSISEVSPITVESSNHMVRGRSSFSPVSPSSPGKTLRPVSALSATPSMTRPVSDISRLSAPEDWTRPVSLQSESSVQQNPMKTPNEVTAAPLSVESFPPANNNLAVNLAPEPPSATFPITSATMQGPPAANDTALASGPGSESPQATIRQADESAVSSVAMQSLGNYGAERGTPERTPEPDRMESIQFKPYRNQAKSLEKRSSALGHPKKSSSIPKHHASNASRFSFQFASESAAQEQELEEKHRKMQSREIAHSIPRGHSPDEEDGEDYFDEDAMDDMDEMELQAAQQDHGEEYLEVPMQSSLYLQQARQALHRQDSDDGSVYNEEDIPDGTNHEDVTYSDHPSFNINSALDSSLRHQSLMPGGTGEYWRGSTIDHYMRDSYHAAAQSRTQSQVSGFHFDFSGAAPEHSLQTEDTSSAQSSSIVYSDPSIQAAGTVHDPSTHNGRSVGLVEANTDSDRARILSGGSLGQANAENILSAVQNHLWNPLHPNGEQIVSEMSNHTYNESRSSKIGAGSSLRGLKSVSVVDTTMASPGDQQSNGEKADVATSNMESSTLQTVQNARTDGWNDTKDNLEAMKEPHDDGRGSSLSKTVAAASLGVRPVTAGSLRDESVPDSRNETSILTTSSCQDVVHDVLNIDGLKFKELSGRESRLTQDSSPSSQASTKQGQGSHNTPSASPLSTGNVLVEHSSKTMSFETGPTGQNLSNLNEFGLDETLLSLPSPVASKTEPSGSESASSITNDSLGEAAGRHNSNRYEMRQQDLQAMLRHQQSSESLSGNDRFRNNGGPVQQVPVTLETSIANEANAGEELSIINGRSPKIVSLHHASQSTGGAGSKDNEAVQHTSWNEPRKHSSPDLDFSAVYTMPNLHGSKPSSGRPEISRQIIQSASVAPPAFTEQQGPQQNATFIQYEDADDMYFDDGNFDQDIDYSQDPCIDENVFDDDGFLARPGMVKPVNYRHDKSPLTYTGVGVEALNTSFAASHGVQPGQPLSQPAQAPFDPRYIPQRNPSEDMKRHGLGNQMPPAPVPEEDKEAFTLMQASLQNYHAALAEAANKAAADGRFVRAPSVSTVRSMSLRLQVPEDKPNQFGKVNIAIDDDKSVYSIDEGRSTQTTSHFQNLVNDTLAIDRSDTTTSRLTHLTNYSPAKMSFDFGFDAPLEDDNDYFLGGDDDLVAAANAEVLASDDEGFYGHEFDFYGRPRANSGELHATNGGFFGQDGDDGLQRNKSLKEPNLTPITERSEFSTRNSFILGQYGPASAGPYGPQSPALARMPVLPLHENDVTSFDDLRRLKANAFGDSNSLRSNSNRSSAHSLHAAFSPSANVRAGYFSGAPPMQFGYSNDSSGSSNPAVPLTGYSHSFQDSPKSAGSSVGLPFAMDIDATPRKNTGSSQMAEPTTARKVPPSQTSGHQPYQTHSRNGSGADSIGYVQEPDPENHGKPRWVLERRRTSEQGQIELIGREVLHSGWI